MRVPIAAETARARYVGPTDSVGARIVVTWRGRQKTLPFNYAVADTFAWAAAQTVGVAESQVERVYDQAGRNNPDNRLYAIEPDQQT